MQFVPEAKQATAKFTDRLMSAGQHSSRHAPAESSRPQLGRRRAIGHCRVPDCVPRLSLKTALGERTARFLNGFFGQLQLSETCAGGMEWGRGWPGYALANKGYDTRSLQAYLVHRNIQHTVRYTELSPTRFKDFWRQ